MPNRILKESICTSDSVDSLSWFEEVLFYRLIVNCDDYGRFDGRPAIIKNRLFPLKESLTTKAISKAVNTLVIAGLVVLYEFEGKPYLYLPTWNDHQNVRAKRSKYPSPEGCVIAHENICNHMYADVPVIQSESESNNIPPYSPKGECSPTGEAPPHSKRFIPPDAEEVQAYCRERNNHIDAQRFVDFYASKGWKVGKEPMKDWKAAVRTWERRNDTPARASPRPNRGRDQYSTRSYSAKDLEKMGNEVSLE